MKYTIEIEASAKTLKDTMNYLRKKSKSVHIYKSSLNFKPLEEGELALPMKKKLTKAQLREYFDRVPGRSIPLEVARKRLLKNLAKKKNP